MTSQPPSDPISPDSGRLPHWTYRHVADKEELAQGDIIQPNAEIRGILGEAHKHFCDPKYSAFIVITQTCDLVRRDGEPCKSRYINIAVVRQLEDVLLSLLDTECVRVKIANEILRGVYHENSLSTAERLLTRILNQNEHGLGLFYLHPDADIGIAVPSVALLQVNIALRKTHYDILLRNRSGGLNSAFQSRLGWIVGNLYSRVATPDWPEEKRSEIIKDILTPSDPVEGSPIWIHKDIVAEAKKNKVQVLARPIEDIIKEIKGIKLKSKKDRVIDCVMTVLEEVLPPTTSGQYNVFRQHLVNDPTLAGFFKK